tara:strand:+ start:215 stop:544 length:330 start_codon:yes stop_codon:yes gene_type:complete
MKKIYTLLIILFFILNACTTNSVEKQILLKQKQESQRLEDIKTCKYYGFEENTNNFSMCLMKLDSTRKELMITRKMLECQNVRKDNSTSGVTGFWGGVLLGARESLACD